MKNNIKKCKIHLLQHIYYDLLVLFSCHQHKKGFYLESIISIIKIAAIWYVFTDIALLNCWNVPMSFESNKGEAQHSFWNKHQMSYLTVFSTVECLFSGPCMSLDSSSHRPLCVSVTQSKDWMRSKSIVCESVTQSQSVTLRAETHKMMEAKSKELWHMKANFLSVIYGTVSCSWCIETNTLSSQNSILYIQ